MSTQPTTLRARIDDHDVCYWLRRGSERGILFLHGLGCSKESFATAFEHGIFPDELTLVAPDLLGHGESSQPTSSSYSLETHGALVVRLAQEIDLRELYVVGHSMGGAIGLLCVDRLPALVGFHCLEGNLIAEDCSVARRIASVGESHFVERLFPLAPARFRCRGLPTEPPASPVAFYRSARSLLEWSQSGALLGALHALGVKKTYVYGGDNDGMPVLSRLDGIELVRIDGCGHFMMLDQPRETYRAIRDRL